MTKIIKYMFIIKMYIFIRVIFFFNDTATTEIYTLSLHERSSDLRLLCAGRASPSPAQLLAFAPGKEQAAGVWEPSVVPDCCLSSALAFPSDLGARRPCRGLRGWGVCTLPKPPAGRALSEGKEAPQAAFPSWCFPAQTKRRTEGIRVPVPLAWGGSSTARVLLRLCPESACQTGPSLEPGEYLLSCLFGLPTALRGFDELFGGCGLAIGEDLSGGPAVTGR